MHTRSFGALLIDLTMRRSSSLMLTSIKRIDPVRETEWEWDRGGGRGLTMEWEHRRHQTQVGGLYRDLPKMNDGVEKPVSEDFDCDTLFAFENSIAGRSELKYGQTWVFLAVYPRQCVLSTGQLMLKHKVSIGWLRFDSSFVNLNEAVPCRPPLSCSYCYSQRSKMRDKWIERERERDAAD